ncbi:RHS repeat domain-containing protein [Pseudomonas sp. MN1F]|uniref:RHS repeat domain-containing protein n=1 Tax=Pseudomonas sp. MN1F TaxID=1366632 RepID=UPI00128F2828|nr:RHS repeat-associated core domain-containing protein [Pseudomonas sp. MN1F]MQG91083.1 RHS repeat protein [Pseudomonas sp. MN1F]
MQGANASLHKFTPEVSVSDNRGLIVRSVRFHRHPDNTDSTDCRVTHLHFDARGHNVQCMDPRLAQSRREAPDAPPNLLLQPALSGAVIGAQSVDAGTLLALDDCAGRSLMRRSGVGVTRRWNYQSVALAGRLHSIDEQAEGAERAVCERWIWALDGAVERASNLLGECVRHYDTGGLQQVCSIALTGTPLLVARQMLRDAERPEWLGEHEQGWQAKLEPIIHVSGCSADATGAALTQTDARGHRQRHAYDVAGRLSSCSVRVQGEEQERRVLEALTWTAVGQKQRELHGNGVLTQYLYEAQTQRVSAIRTERPEDHPAGARLLQCLRYVYDPVGNVASVGNAAQTTRFWRNQKVSAENTFIHDSLYQLVQACGRELAAHGQQGVGVPPAVVPLAGGPEAFTRYRRDYQYDSGGNLTHIRHNAPGSGNSYTTQLVVSPHGNRAMRWQEGLEPGDIEGMFDKSGHALWLQAGQPLQWNPRGELERVVQVARSTGDDNEHYRYDGAGRRLLKITSRQSGDGIQQRRVLYLPGLELRDQAFDGAAQKALEVVAVGSAGRGQVRLLHWPDGLTGDSLRYSFDDLLGSSQLELDEQGEVISQEEYYPYGGTAVWTARSEVEADYKTLRYSGKECDATGLYYYGLRYYQPWLGRWLSADPAGVVDGLNLYRMVRNNPVTFKDQQGLDPVYPVLSAFLADVMTDVNHDALGFVAWGEQLDSAPPWAIAIWGDNTYVSTVNRHMSIRPPGEQGFPDFVGVYDGNGITTETGHYRTPPDYAARIENNRPRITSHGSTASLDWRMTMFSDPQAYMAKVNEFWRINDRAERGLAVLAFLKSHWPQGLEELASSFNQNRPVLLLEMFQANGQLRDVEQTGFQWVSQLYAEANQIIYDFVDSKVKAKQQQAKAQARYKYDAVMDIYKGREGDLHTVRRSEVEAQLPPATHLTAPARGHQRRPVTTVTQPVRRPNLLSRIRHAFKH